jgi:Fe-S-cluster containining protein
MDALENQAGPVYSLNAGLPIQLSEKEKIEKELEIIGKKGLLKIGSVILERSTGELATFSYCLEHEPCPFIGRDNSCKIYENRPNACRAFPIEAFYTAQNPAAIINSSTDICRENLFKENYPGLGNAPEKNKIVSALHEYYGENYVYAAMIHIESQIKNYMMQCIENNRLFISARGKRYPELKSSKNACGRNIFDLALETGALRKRDIDLLLSKINYDEAKILVEENCKNAQFVVFAPHKIMRSEA